jgi:hypothetical protein
LAKDALASSEGALEARAILDVLRATGLTAKEAQGTMEGFADTFSWDEVAPLWGGIAQPATEAWSVNFTRSMCDTMAGASFAAANVAFSSWLAAAGSAPRAALDLTHRSWLASLPEGLRFGGPVRLEGCAKLQAIPKGFRVDAGGLDLSECHSLEALADDLRVQWGLVLWGCGKLRALPEGLCLEGDLNVAHSGLERLPERARVEGSLYLVGCRAWDGRIPAGVAVLDKVFTDEHREGVPLDLWRHLHPNGETVVADQRAKGPVLGFPR